MKRSVAPLVAVLLTLLAPPLRASDHLDGPATSKERVTSVAAGRSSMYMYGAGLAIQTCGGRTPADDVMDVLLGLYAGGLDGKPIRDGVDPPSRPPSPVNRRVGAGSGAIRRWRRWSWVLR